MSREENSSEESLSAIRQKLKQELLKRFAVESSLLTEPILEEIVQQARQNLFEDVQVGRDLRINGNIIQEIVQTIELPSPPVPIGIHHNLPYSGTVKFIGRISELERLHQKLQQTEKVAITAITGMGGVGKTELALQYALQYQDNYPGSLCWFKAREQDLSAQILEFAGTYFNVYPTEKQKSDSAKVKYCWSRWGEERALIVLDDVPDYGEYYQEKIKPYLPPSDVRFKVLMTSRQHPGTSMEEIDLDVLSPEAALALMEALIGEGRIEAERDEAKALCEWLGYLPLGLELVGRYLEIDPSLSIETTLKRLEEQKLEAEALLKPEQADMTAQLGVAAAFELSWQELNSEAQRLGAYLSLFTPEPFEWRWVEKSLRRDLGSNEGATSQSRWKKISFNSLSRLFNRQSLETKAKEQKKQREVAEELNKRDLLKRNLLRIIPDAQSPNKYLYQLHALIQQYFRAKLEELEQAEELKQKFCQQMIEIAQSIPDTPTQSDIRNVALAIPHLSMMAKDLTDYIDNENLIWSFAGLDRFYRGQGAYDRAEEWCERSLTICCSRLGEEHPDVALSLNNLALLYYYQGRYEEAEPLYQQALEMTRKLRGEEHPDVATSLNNLANLYSSQGRYEEAEPLYQQALEMRRKLRGEEHPSVALSLNNLAGLYYYQGRYEEAEPLYQQALTIAEQVLGKNHPHTNTIRAKYEKVKERFY